MTAFILEGFTEGDELLMKAKINFTATAVGNHPNVIKFIGAVMDDHTGKPLKPNTAPKWIFLLGKLGESIFHFKKVL